MRPDHLLTRLSRLLSSQFEEVLYRARIPPAYLPGATASQMERAIAAMRYVEQQGQLKQLTRIIERVVSAGTARSGQARRDPR